MLENSLNLSATYLKSFLSITAFILLLKGCVSREYDEFKVAKINDSTEVRLQLGSTNMLICTVYDSITSIWPLRYPVYQYQFGDINHNGNVDLAVGVFKATRYDSIKRNRLFLFQVRNNSIIPLWLGSSVGHPIVDFRVLEDSHGDQFIRILGLEKSEKYLIADYVWYGFGLTLSHYARREIATKIAKEYFYKDI